MGDRTEHMEHELAGGRGGIEALLEADQVDAAGLEAVDDFEKFSERASQTVEPGDAQSVAGSSVVDELGKTGAVRALSGGDVGEETDGACLEQAVLLRAEALVGGRDAGVAQRVARTGGGGRINIDRFRDGVGVRTTAWRSLRAAPCCPRAASFCASGAA